MEITQLIPHVEALIFASDRPLSTLELTDLINQAFGFMEDKIPMDQVEAAVEGVAEKYAAEFYPFEVRQSGGGVEWFVPGSSFCRAGVRLDVVSAARR